MRKMKCAEAVYDALVGKVTAALDHDSLDDLVRACCAIASGESKEPDVVAWIAARDKERSEWEICSDICAYFRYYHGPVKPSEVIAKAIAAGRAAMGKGDEA